MAKGWKKKVQENTGPDQFQSVSGKIIHWSNENQKPILILLLVVFVVGGLWALMKEQRNSQEKEASASLFEADNKAPKLKAVAEKYEGTQASVQALLELGKMELKGKAPKKASEYFIQASQITNKPTLKALSLLSAATALEMAGDWDGAEGHYKKILDLEVAGIYDEALLSLGRGLIATNRKAEGRNYLEQLTAGESNPTLREAARKILDENP